MRGKFDTSALRDQLLMGNLGPRPNYDKYRDYEEIDEEDYDHMERDDDEDDFFEDADEEGVIIEEL